MNCQTFRSMTSAQNDPSFEHAFSASLLVEQGEHTKTCLDCVRWLEEAMDAEDLARGVTAAVPTAIPVAIPGEAAVAIEREASERLDKTNAHLRRTIAEAHKMMVWHQYAAAALQGLLAQGYWPGNTTVREAAHQMTASRACEYADAMMEQIRQRKLM